MLHEIAHFRRRHFVDFRPDGAFGLDKLLIAGLQLFHTFQIGADLIRRLDDFPKLPIRLVRKQQRLIHRLQFRRQHFIQATLGEFLNSIVSALDFRVKIFDRRRQVTGEYFAGLVKSRQRHDPILVHRPAEHGIANDRQPMRHQGDLQAMLLDIFLIRIAHQPPTADQSHPGQIGVKMFHFPILFSAEFIYNSTRNSRSG